MKPSAAVQYERNLIEVFSNSTIIINIFIMLSIIDHKTQNMIPKFSIIKVEFYQSY